MSSPVAGENRLAALVGQITLGTRALLVINIAVHVIIFLFTLPIGLFSISFVDVVLRGEVYRIVTAAYVHVGIVHIFMNMSSLWALGPDLEQKFGTSQFLIMTLWSTFIIGFLYVGLSWIAFKAIDDTSQLVSSAVGFSGVLFAYAIIECFHTTQTTRSLFGAVNVPARVYPFILLVILQVALPGISFAGHLAGVIVGLFAISGLLAPFMPSPGWLLSCLVASTRYCSLCGLS